MKLNHYAEDVQRMCRLTRAERQLVLYCHESITLFGMLHDPRTGAPPKPHIIEVGSRGAEVASHILWSVPDCTAKLVGGWPSPRRTVVLQWFERREWDDRLAMALRRTEFKPPRRFLHRCDPEDAVTLIADYSSTCVVFTESASIGLLNLWWRKVRAGGSMCGVRSRETDDSVLEWITSVKLADLSDWAKRTWCVDKPL